MNAADEPLSGGPDDRVALTALASARPRFVAWLRRHAPSSADVEDVMQDVFVEFVLANRAARQIENATAWLFRVARNRLVDAHRRRGIVVDAHRAADGADTEPASPESRWPDPAAGPEAAYGHRLLGARVTEALQALPDDQRDVFVAHEIEGLSFQAIAARAGVGVNTVLARKHRAVKALRRSLRQTYVDHFTA